MTRRWIASLALVLPLAAGSAARAGRVVDELVFQGDGEGVPVLRLIETAREVTGEPFFFEPRDVANQSVTFTGTVAVPRERFLPFFDWCLRQAEFVHLEQTAGGVTMHLIRRLGQQARGQQALKTMARCVSPEELPALADRHTLITTTWIAKNLPAREAVTTLQLYFADSATESIRNVEGTNAVLMTGFASNVASIVALADRLDAAVPEDTVFERRRNLEERIARLEDQVAKLQQQAGAAKPAGR